MLTSLLLYCICLNVIFKKSTLFFSTQEKGNLENVVEGMSGPPAFIAVLFRRTLKPFYEVCSDDNAMKTFNLNVLESHHN